MTSEKSMEFIPPTSSVKKEEWVKDEKVSSCMQCHQAFSMVKICFFLFLNQMVLIILETVKLPALTDLSFQ